MSLITIQRSPTPPGSTDTSSTSQNDESDGVKSQSEDFFASKATAVLQNQVGRRRSSVIKEGDNIQSGLKKALNLLRKEDSLKLIVNLEKKNAANEGYRYFCVIVTNGKQDTEEFLILGVDICLSTATIGLVLPICQDMSVMLDGDGGFKVKNKTGEKLFKPTSVHALWSTVQLLNRACSIAREHNYYVGGLSHTWIGVYLSKIYSNRAQIAEWNLMIDADTKTNSKLAPNSAVGDIVFGTHVDESIRNKDEIRKHLKEIMRDEDMDTVTVTFLRERLQEVVAFNLQEYRSFIAEEILIICGQMDCASEILPYLYLGSTYNASNLDELTSNEITHILNVTRESENFFREKFIYRNVEVFDHDNTDLLNHFNDCFQFITEAKEKNCCCLVHCQRGISRSATVVIAYIMKALKLSRDEALARVKKSRECVHPNDGFMLQLKTYEGMLNAKTNYISKFYADTSDHNQWPQGEKRTKIMSLTSDLYQINERDCESQTNLGLVLSTRQSLSHYLPPVPDDFSTATILMDPSTMDDSTLACDMTDPFSHSPQKIDIHEDLLIYKTTNADDNQNDCWFNDNDLKPVLSNEESVEIMKNVYQRGSASTVFPDFSTSTSVLRLSSDSNANEASIRYDPNDVSRRSIRLKGDNSWIKSESSTVMTEQNDNKIIESSNRRGEDSLIGQGVDLDGDDVGALVGVDSGCETVDIDNQSLRSVKELKTRYSNTEN